MNLYNLILNIPFVGTANVEISIIHKNIEKHETRESHL